MKTKPATRSILYLVFIIMIAFCVESQYGLLMPAHSALTQVAIAKEGTAAIPMPENVTVFEDGSIKTDGFSGCLFPSMGCTPEDSTAVICVPMHKENGQ